jgi:hypothetical protein
MWVRVRVRTDTRTNESLLTAKTRVLGVLSEERHIEKLLKESNVLSVTVRRKSDPTVEYEYEPIDTKKWEELRRGIAREWL